MNIAFQFVILILQNHIQRNKLYHGIWNIFMVLGTKSNNFWWCTCYLKRMRMHIWDIVLESHGRLDKTVHVESSVKACRSRQPWVVFWIFHGIRHVYARERNKGGWKSSSRLFLIDQEMKVKRPQRHNFWNFGPKFGEEIMKYWNKIVTSNLSSQRHPSHPILQ